MNSLNLFSNQAGASACTLSFEGSGLSGNAYKQAFWKGAVFLALVASVLAGAATTSDAATTCESTREYVKEKPGIVIGHTVGRHRVQIQGCTDGNVITSVTVLKNDVEKVGVAVRAETSSSHTQGATGVPEVPVILTGEHANSKHTWTIRITVTNGKLKAYYSSSGW